MNRLRSAKEMHESRHAVRIIVVRLHVRVPQTEGIVAIKARFDFGIDRNSKQPADLSIRIDNSRVTEHRLHIASNPLSVLVTLIGRNRFASPTNVQSSGTNVQSSGMNTQSSGPNAHPPRSSTGKHQPVGMSNHLQGRSRQGRTNREARRADAAPRGLKATPATIMAGPGTDGIRT